MLNGNDIRLLVFSRFEVQKISYLGKGQRRMYVNTFICVCMYIYIQVYMHRMISWLKQAPRGCTLHTNFPTDLSCGDMGLSRRDDVALSQQKQIVLNPSNI